MPTDLTPEELGMLDKRMQIEYKRANIRIERNKEKQFDIGIVDAEVISESLASLARTRLVVKQAGEMMARLAASFESMKKYETDGVCRVTVRLIDEVLPQLAALLARIESMKGEK
jgi:hypothetical protein